MSRRNLLLVRVGVFVLAVAFLLVRLRGHQGMHALCARWAEGGIDPWVLVAVLVAMLLNWGLEARKWQVLMQRIQQLSFLRAFTAVIAGTSIGLITPNRVGEFAGRVLFLDPGHRIDGAFATVLGSIAQFVITLLFGAMVSVAYLLQAPPGADLALQGLTWAAIGVGLLATVLYFEPGLLGRLFLAVPFLRRFERHVQVLQSFQRPVLFRVFLLSGLRYGVFTAQFALVLIAFAAVPWSTSALAVPLVFLVTTLVPTTMLTEIGVRVSAAVAFIPGDPIGVMLASTVLWAVNLMLPAAVGSVVLLLARLRTETHAA